MCIRLGHIVTRNRVFLAPMAGITDAPFRAAAWRNGAGMVTSEMIAGDGLRRGHAEVLRRLRRRIAADEAPVRPFVVQLAGRDPATMAEGARLAVDAGADVIDINMGCPARLVAGRLAGAALMRDEARALAIVEAVVAAAGDLPVTVKMRLGWDRTSINAPRIARLAEGAGARMITVHARTRACFYAGRADWSAVRAVVEAVSVPVVVNGDIVDASTARRALAASGAAAVMIGRAARGRPWLPGEIAHALDGPGHGVAPLPLARQIAEIRRLHADMLAFHGRRDGIRRARKHLGWALDAWHADGRLTEPARRRWRARLLREDNPARVREALAALADTLLERERAA